MANGDAGWPNTIRLEMARRLIDEAIRHPGHTTLIGVGGLTFLYAISSLWLPFGWDHGIMASVGADMLDGAALYRDSWDTKSPLTYVPFAFATFLFGNNMWGLRIVDLLILIPLLTILARETGVRTNWLAGISASLGIYLWVAGNGWFFTAQPDAWAALMCAVAACASLPREGRPRPQLNTFVLAGILIACAGLIKPLYMAFGLSPLIAAALAPGDIITRLRDASGLAFGAALPIGLAILLLAASGALAATIEAQILYNLGSYGDVKEEAWKIAANVQRFLGQGSSIIALILAAIGLWSKRRDHMFLAQTLVWLAAGVFVIVVQNKYYAYHWYAMLPALLFCSALGLHALMTQATKPPQYAAYLAAGLFAVLISVEPARSVKAWGMHILNVQGYDYYARFSHWTYHVPDQIKAARHIRTNSEPTDGVFVWGNDATVRYLADRHNPARFVFDMPLILEGPFLDTYRQDTLNALAQAPPRFIVIGTSWTTSDKQLSLAGFPEFRDFLTSNYERTAEYGNVHLYSLEDR